MKAAFSFNYGDDFFSFKDGAFFSRGGVRVEAKEKSYTDFDALEWVLNFENNSHSDSLVFSDIFDCHIELPLKLTEPKRPGYMPKDGDLCVEVRKGVVEGSFYHDNDLVSATEFTLCREYLDKASKTTKSFSSKSGRSSYGYLPFFDVTASGEGYIVAIGWSGGWRAEFSRGTKGAVVKTGLNKARFYLKSGEKIRTTSVVIMKYFSFEDKYNKFRRFVKKHFTAENQNPLMAFELWGGLDSAEMKKRLSQLRSCDIKFDQVWLDAAWYGDCDNCISAYEGNWSKQTGNWKINERIHPGQLKDVSEAANEIGAKLMLWFEPERAYSNFAVVKEHPGWFIHSESRGYSMLDYSHPEALEYAFKTIDGYVKGLGLGCYRQDCNFNLDEFFALNDTPDRVGITEIKHIRGMYELWDRLIEANPGLIIDNCASGGRRIDIESIRRTQIFFRSDYQCNFNEEAEVLQVHNSNISQLLPYNGCTTKTKGDVYSVRSSYSSCWGGAFYNAVFQSCDGDDLDWIKKYTDEYRSIRRYMSCDFYNHCSSVFDPSSWCVWQYHDPEDKSGVILAFRRKESPFEYMALELKGVSEGETLVYEDVDEGQSFEGDNCLNVILNEKRSCKLIKYRVK